MAYPYYPATYQPMYPSQQAAPTPQSGGINWVQGESGAKSFLVAPNTSVMLMDSEDEVFYIKTSDASGMPLPLRVFEYRERGKSPDTAIIPQPSIDLSSYVTKDEFEAFCGSISGKLDALSRRNNGGKK